MRGKTNGGMWDGDTADHRIGAFDRSAVADGQVGLEKGALNVSALGAMAVGHCAFAVDGGGPDAGGRIFDEIPFIGQVCTGL